MSPEIEKVWTTKAGFRAVCLFADAMRNGHRCGYVGIPKGHQLHGIHYNSEVLSQLSVHGGLTYSDGDDDYPVAASDVWWLGFDCAHSFDDPRNGGRSEEFVVAECESVAEQIALLTPGPATCI